MDPIVLVDVDDADTRIQYSDGWSTGTNRNAYGRTLHYAQLAGITATLTFNGTLVAVLGCGGDTASIGYPSTSIVIDGKNDNVFHVVTNTPASPVTLSYNMTLFASPALAPGEHTLVLTNLNQTPPNLFVLDRFWYMASDDSPTSTSEVVQQQTVTISASPHAESTATHLPNIGAIVGGVVGGAVALLLAGIGTYRLMKRKSSRRPREISFIESETVYSPATEHISPFTPAVAASHSQFAVMDSSFRKDPVSSPQGPDAEALSASPDIRPARLDPPLVPRTSLSDSAFTQRAVSSPENFSSSSPLPPGHTAEHGLSSPSHSSVDDGSLPPYTE